MKRSVSLFSAALLSVLAFTSVSHSETENIVLTKRTKEIYENSSEANRMNKNGTILVNLVGVGPGGAGGTGLAGGLHLDRNKLLLAEIRGGKGAITRSYSSSNGFESTSGESESTINQIGLHYKQFVGNSFYFRMGGDYSQVDFKYDFDMAGSSSSDFKSKFEGEALHANFTIGNQWQWENFTLGCDWVGLASPVYSKVKSQSLTGNPLAQDRQDFEDDKKMLLTGGSAVLLRLYLGATF
ncbi:MAG: hypothetical protein ACK5RO_06010 [Pseudobdellovibrionaceae bacterium]